MTLSKRAILLIFPVIFCSYVVAAAVIYMAERSATLALEQTRLEQQVDQLGVMHENDEIRARETLRSLLTAVTFSTFRQDLAARMERTLRDRILDSRDFLSLSLISPERRVLYYGDTSADPFAWRSEEQLAQATSLLSDPARTYETVFRQTEKGFAFLISELIDPVTMAPPVETRRAAAYVVQTEMRAALFSSAFADLAESYGTAPVLGERMPDTTGELVASRNLADNLLVGIMIPAEYLTERTRDLLWLLSIGAMVMSIGSILLLGWLVQWFVTRPVQELDRRVAAIIDGTRSKIGMEAPSAEIARLSDGIERLHATAQSSLRQIQTAFYTDPLTGISNRAHFSILSDQALQAARQGDAPLSLLFMDIDRFKFVNDTYGHAIGDELLRAVATRLAKTVQVHCLGDRAFVARLSGDEFAALVPVEGEEAAALASAIGAQFENGFRIGSECYPIGISIGIASRAVETDAMATLLANADMAMYEAKNQGRNGYAFYSTDVSIALRRERQIQSELERVDPDQEFSLVYMPIVDRTGRVAGCEALVRWTSPTLGSVPPAEFVPIGERSNLFAKIDRWVVDNAIKDCASLKTLFDEDFILSINASSAQMRSTAFLDYLKDRCKFHGVPESGIEIEFTETFEVSDSLSSARSVESLRDNGFGVAIDDFGAGFTCFRQVLGHRASTVKLDRIFVDHLINARSDTSLTAFIALLHAEGMKVVGEGVDTNHKHSRLSSAGCDLFQGFGISPPLPLNGLSAWASRLEGGRSVQGMSTH